MSPWRRVGLAGGAGGVLAIVLLLATAGADPSRRALTLLLGAALAAAVVGPWRAAGRGPARARAIGASIDVLAGLGALTLVGLPFASATALLLGGAWVALFALALVALTLLVGRAGQVVATAAGLCLVAWPYVGGPVASSLPPDDRPAALERTLLTPVPALGGTFARTDVMRSAGLYSAFPLGQSLPFSYASPRAALEVVGLAAVALAALALARRRLGGARPARVPAPLLALALMALAPGEARAQLFPEPGPVGGEPTIGPLETRVQLGYWVTDLEGYVKVDGFGGTLEGSKLYFDRTLGLQQIFVVPTFEVHLAWQNAGRVSIQYFEGYWYGEQVSTKPLTYEENVIPPGSYLESRYRFRTIALAGELQIPLTDFLVGKLITTQRYVKFESKIRAIEQGISDRNSVETLVPTVGVGLDVLVWDMISAYGEFQYLDFTIDWFGAKDGRWDFRYQEWRLGVRLELVEHAHVMLEWYSLDLTVEDGRQDRYKQELQGPRLQVAILF